MSIYRNLVIGVVVALIIVGGAYALVHRSPEQNSATSVSTTTTPVPVSVGGQVSEGSGTPVTTTISAPSYSVPLSFSASMSSDVQQALQAQFAAIKKQLASNPTDFSSWIDLGIIRKTTGDYQGAATDWGYVSEIYPTSIVPFDDLGDLYTNFIKNYPKAESNYLQAVKNDPHNLVSYEGLASLYTTYGYKSNTSAAADILKQGIATNPSATDLYVLLARYYKGVGDTADAKAQYDKAIVLAKQQNNTDLANVLTQEEATL